MERHPFAQSDDEERRLNPQQECCAWCSQPVYEGNVIRSVGVAHHLHCKRANHRQHSEWRVDNFTAGLRIELDAYEGTLVLHCEESGARIYVHRNAFSNLRAAIAEAEAEQRVYDSK
jgi:hypothetical protein